MCNIILLNAISANNLPVTAQSASRSLQRDLCLSPSPARQNGRYSELTATTVFKHPRPAIRGSASRLQLMALLISEPTQSSPGLAPLLASLPSIFHPAIPTRRSRAMEVSAGREMRVTKTGRQRPRGSPLLAARTPQHTHHCRRKDTP